MEKIQELQLTRQATYHELPLVSSYHKKKIYYIDEISLK